MTDDLVKRLRKRAANDRKIQANNEAIATALKGQRLLFDQGIRSDANTFAVRLGLDYENCGKNDAKLAADWEKAADAIEALTAERDGLLRCVTDNHVALCRAEKAEAERDLLREALDETAQILSQCTFETIRVHGQYIDRREAVSRARVALKGETP